MVSIERITVYLFKRIKNVRRQFIELIVASSDAICIYFSVSPEV